MSTLPANQPPRKVNQQPSPSFFSSLPNDIVLEILARVPKRSYPILSCVCKNFRILIRSPAIHTIRSVLNKDSVYFRFVDIAHLPRTSHWFTLSRIENNPTENLFAPVDPPFPFYKFDPSIIAVGSEIFFICRSLVPSSSLSIFNTRSGKFRRGPSMQVNLRYKMVGLVGDKIYVIGVYKNDEIRAQLFDLKIQNWEAAPTPRDKGSLRWLTTANVSLDNKVYGLNVTLKNTVYNTRDGSCEYIEMPKDKWWRPGVCVIDNVLYVYFASFGLMCYDSKLMLWRVVYGLNLNKVQSVGMADYYGKLALFYIKSGEFWCRIIALNKSEAGIHGTGESSQLLGIIPNSYRLEHCLSLSG